MFTLKALRTEDGLFYDVNVLASRFLQVDGPTFPLLSSVEPNNSIPVDESHGLLFAAPYYLNANLPAGSFATDDIFVTMTGSGPESTASSTFRVSSSFNILNPTNTVDVSPGKTFISQEINSTVPSNSSVYFVATDKSIGPTQRIWFWLVSNVWNGYNSLSIPMFSSCLGGFVNGSSVTAIIIAQQCSCNYPSSVNICWEMNAGRWANACGHTLKLLLAPISFNPWRSTIPSGCVLSTHPSTPVVIEARRYHSPLENLLLYTFVLNITFTL